MRTQNREIRRAQRDVDKSRNDIEKQEKQLEIQIKKAAKEGNKQLCQTLAKQLVQLRKSRTRTVAVGANIGAIGSKSKIIQANNKMAEAMANTTKTMSEMNAQLKPQQMMKTMQDFEKENQMMSMKEEMIEDTLNGILDESGDEEEQDAVVAQVLDEIGIEITGKMASAPTPSRELGSTSTAKSKFSDSEIEAQLAKLKM
ncbi:unnamed protein product [Oppiella nova]|nr:unnamed protein product [Oppiella nova]CAG2158935.1 unnamed protein product [Oppiella nova]